MTQEEVIWSYYWNCEGEFTKGPQPCACGRKTNSDFTGCPDRDKHITEYLKKQGYKR